MCRKLCRLFPLLILLAATPSTLGHITFHLAVDELSNVYFLDVFKNTLVKVSPDGTFAVLTDFRTVEPDKRLHSMALGPEGHLFVAGYHRRTLWRCPPTGGIHQLDLAGNTEPGPPGVLHLGFDAKEVLYTLQWHYAAPRETQEFHLHRFRDVQTEPEVLFTSRGDEEDFLDFHLGSMLVTGDGSVYFSNTNRIWKLGDDRHLRLVAGSPERGFVDGTGRKARFDSPYGMAVDRDGSLLVAERSGRLRRVSPEGLATTVAGTEERGHQDGAPHQAQFAEVFGVGVGVDPKGRIYVGEYQDKVEYRIRVIVEDRVTTLARIPSDGVFVK